MSIADQSFTLAGVIVGGGTAYVIAALTERTRARRETIAQWSERRSQAYTAFMIEVMSMTTLVRRIMATRGLAGRSSRSNPIDVEAGIAELAEAESRRGIAYQAVALLAGPSVMSTARELNYSAWRLEHMARQLPEAQSDDFNEAFSDYESRADRFLLAAREELGIPKESIYSENITRHLIDDDDPEAKNDPAKTRHTQR